MPSRPILFLMLTFIMLTGLAACGQKGPLYFPEPPTSNETSEKAS